MIQIKTADNADSICEWDCWYLELRYTL